MIKNQKLKYRADSVERIVFSFLLFLSAIRSTLSAKQCYPLNAKIPFFLLLSFFIFHFSLTCFAQPISSTELINKAKQYDGKTVVYEGEVIGDVMKRGDYAWVNLNDDKNVLGVWIPRDLTKEILFTGNYKTKGDWIEITGIFQRACNQHGGDLDIHAQTIKKIIPGRPLQEKLNPAKRDFAFILLVILIILFFACRLPLNVNRKR